MEPKARAAGPKRGKTETLMDAARRMPLVRQLVPMEAATGWPLPLRRDGRVFVQLPFFSYETAGKAGETTLYPPFAVLTFDWLTGNVVEYSDLRFRGVTPVGERQAVGVFPHPEVAGWSVADYNARRAGLLSMYDELFDTLAKGAAFDPAWTARFGAAFRSLVEPGLAPYYEKLAPRFIGQFLGEPVAAGQA